VIKKVLKTPGGKPGKSEPGFQTPVTLTFRKPGKPPVVIMLLANEPKVLFENIRLVPTDVLNETDPNACGGRLAITPVPLPKNVRLPHPNMVFALMLPVVEPPAVAPRQEAPVEPAVIGVACTRVEADKQIASTESPKKITERFIIDLLDVVTDKNLVRVDREKRRCRWLAVMQKYPLS